MILKKIKILVTVLSILIVNKNDLFVNDLYLFYRTVMTAHYGMKRFIKAPHIKVLSRYLMKLKLGVGKLFLAVAMPPRHSKSSMITLVFVLWIIFDNPNSNILIVNYSKELSEKFGIDLRELIKDHGSKYDVYLSNVKSSNTHLMFTNKKGKLYKGRIRLVGKGGSVTGHDADWIILDDIYEADIKEFTPTALNKTIEWFKLKIYQRIEPHTRLIVLHTRWNQNDLIGWLKENKADDFEFIEFKAVSDNKVLWPQKYDLTYFKDKLNTMGHRLFSALYLQKPLDESGEFFPKIQVKDYDNDESIISRLRVWDLSSTTNLTSDYTPGGYFTLTTKGNVYLTSYVRGKWGLKTRDKVQEIAKEDGYNVPILVEFGTGNAILLLPEWREQLKGYDLQEANPSNISKEDRAVPLKHGMLDGNFYTTIRDPEKLEILKEEFNSFPDGVSDDLVDICAYAWNKLKLGRSNPFTNNDKKYESIQKGTKTSNSFTSQMKNKLLKKRRSRG